MEYSAANGPPEHNNTKAKYLEDDIWELKVGPKRGAKLRVLYFHGNSSRIVCTNAFTKTGNAPYSTEIRQAKQIRDDYQNAQLTGNLELITSQQYDEL